MYHGSASGIDPASVDKLTSSDGGTHHEFGQLSQSPGDLDQDGYDDIVIGAWRSDATGYYGGAAYVYYGSASGIDTDTESRLLASDSAQLENYGSAVSIAGDLDQDGHDDIDIGAVGDDWNGRNTGAIYVYAGDEADTDADGVINREDSCTTIANPGQADTDGEG